MRRSGGGGLASLTRLRDLSISDNRFDCQLLHQRQRRSAKAGEVSAVPVGAETVGEVRAWLSGALPECELNLGDEEYDDDTV